MIGAATRDPVRAYRIILLVNIGVTAGLLVYKFVVNDSLDNYHLFLATYENGVIRRAFVGSVYALFFDRFPLWVVTLQNVASWLAAVALFAIVFHRVIRADRLTTVALACFLFGSPYLLKNFLHLLAYFDVLGACVAMLAFLLPLRAWSWALLAVFSAMLISIHHVQATLFVPTIYGIALIRAVTADGWRWPPLAAIAASLAALVALFIALMAFGDPRVPATAMMAAMRRHADREVELNTTVWYVDLDDELDLTGDVFWSLAARAPVYLALVVLHFPLLRLGVRHIRGASADRRAHWLFLAVMAMVIVAYATTFLVARDYARFISDGAFCLVLLTMAHIRVARGPVRDAMHVNFASPWVIACAAILAVIPRVGIAVPF